MLTSKRGTCTTKTVMGCLNASVVISYQCYFGKHESHTLNLTKQWTMQLSKNVALEEARHLSGAEPPHCFQERSCHLKRKIVGSWRAKLQPFWRTLFQHELKEKICWVSTFPQRLGFGRREYKTAMKSGKIQHCKFEELLGWPVLACPVPKERELVAFQHVLWYSLDFWVGHSLGLCRGMYLEETIVLTLEYGAFP